MNELAEKLRLIARYASARDAEVIVEAAERVEFSTLMVKIACVLGVGLIATLMMLFSASCHATERSRFDANPSGPLLSVSDVRVDELTVEFTLGDFKATEGSHLVIGRGDLGVYFRNGERFLGEGVAIGEATACGAAAGVISILSETWSADGGQLHPDTCTTGLERNVRYVLVLTPGRYALRTATEPRYSHPNPLPSAVVVQVPPGYFVLGLGSQTPYTLHSVRARATPPMVKPGQLVKDDL